MIEATARCVSVRRGARRAIQARPNLQAVPRRSRCERVPLFMPVGMNPVFFCYWREVRSWAATRGAQKADPAMLALGSACGLGSTPPTRIVAREAVLSGRSKASVA